MGIPALLFLWTGFGLVVAQALRMRVRMRNSPFADLYTVSLSAAIVLFFVSNQFNDLLNDFDFWLYIVFVVICMSNVRRQQRAERYPSIASPTTRPPQLLSDDRHQRHDS
jgi:hypothetical protein